MSFRIPFSIPFITGNELRFIGEAIKAGQLAADGRFSQCCSALLSKQCEDAKVLMTPSCTAALELALLLCDLRPGDEVILPSFTFVSTANAVIAGNGKPVFVDIRPDTLNLDEQRLQDAITENTRAIVPVHYGGVGCEMQSIMEIAQKHGLRVIEDAAQAVNASYEGRALGSIGDLGAFSFHHTKNYVCGEGGALCINAPELIARAEVLREKGTNRTQFLRGETDKYTWVDVGSSYLLSEVSCAFLYAQLLEGEWITNRRREIFEAYCYLLTPLETAGVARLPVIPPQCQTNYHTFYLLLPDLEVRDGLMEHLKQNGIEAAFHYVPLHSSPMGKKLGYKAQDLPITEDLSQRILRLPIYPQLTDEQQLQVVHHVKNYLLHINDELLATALSSS